METQWNVYSELIKHERSTSGEEIREVIEKKGLRQIHPYNVSALRNVIASGAPVEGARDLGILIGKLVEEGIKRENRESEKCGVEHGMWYPQIPKGEEILNIHKEMHQRRPPSRFGY